jgi:hypothetical protein
MNTLQLSFDFFVISTRQDLPSSSFILALSGGDFLYRVSSLRCVGFCAAERRFELLHGVSRLHGFLCVFARTLCVVSTITASVNVHVGDWNIY